MIRRPPRATRVRSSAASDVYKRQELTVPAAVVNCGADGVPHIRHELPLVDESGGVAVQEEVRVGEPGGPHPWGRVQAHRARGLLLGGGRLAARLWALKEHGACGPEPTG